MSYSTDKRQFIENCLAPGAILVLDNDMCYVSNGDESVSYDFGPGAVARIFADYIGISWEDC